MIKTIYVASSINVAPLQISDNLNLLYIAKRIKVLKKKRKKKKEIEAPFNKDVAHGKNLNINEHSPTFFPTLEYDETFYLINVDKKVTFFGLPTLLVNVYCERLLVI